MPRKDRDARLAYQREWYARPENRGRTIQKTKAYKRAHYSGVCRNCGGRTQGEGPSTIPEWCSKPDCASAQRRLAWREKKKRVWEGDDAQPGS